MSTHSCVLRVLLLLAVASPPLSAQSLLVVDDDGGPGVDHTTLQAAVDALGPGDAILVRPGNYAGFVAPPDGGPPVRMFASAPGVRIHGTVEALSRSVLLQGLSVETTGPGEIGVRLTNPFGVAPAGFWWLERLDVTAASFRALEISAGAHPWETEVVCVASAFECADPDGIGVSVALERAEFHAVDATGGRAMFVTGSDVFGAACRLHGLPGADGLPATDTTPCTDGGWGGYGLVVQSALGFAGGGYAGRFRSFDSAIRGGPGGAAGGPGCVDGEVGPWLALSDPWSSFVDLVPSHPARGFELAGPIASGTPSQILCSGTPGEQVWAAFSDTPLHIPLPATEPPAVLPTVWLPLGRIDDAGALAVPFTATLPPGVPFVVVHAQGFFLSAADGLIAGPPRAVLLFHDGA